ncbi:MAG: hypothetical protein ABJG26_00320, partial [Marinomonas sp.]
MRSGLAVLSAGMLTLLGALAGCSGDAAEQPAQLPMIAANYIAEGNPETLREWGQVQLSGGALVLSDDVVPYDLNTPLFTDYAHKLRTIWMPEGSSVNYRTGEVLDFPLGTVITKTFYYPLKDGGDESQVLRDSSSEFFQGGKLPLGNVRLIETRVLV